MQFREKEQCELKKKENREIKRYIDIYSKGMYILFLYISSIYEKSKQSSFLGSPKPRMDWIVSASANEMKA